jgi:hypothetical protein
MTRENAWIFSPKLLETEKGGEGRHPKTGINWITHVKFPPAHESNRQ